MKIVLGPLLKLLYQPWIRGAENIPEDGPAILASNHLAVIDSFFLPLMIERELVFIGKSDYFTGKGLKGRLVAAFMRGVGTIPVDRTGGKKSMVALQKGLKRLEAGGLFGIYPEGTRSPDGRLHRGKTGVARLALQAGVPVIPVAMIGTNIAQPIGVKIPRLHRIGIVVGEPLDFSRYQGFEGDRFVLRSITDEIMYNLMCISGQEYVDRYAADVKAELASQGKFAGPLPAGAKADTKNAEGEKTDYLPQPGSQDDIGVAPNSAVAEETGNTPHELSQINQTDAFIHQVPDPQHETIPAHTDYYTKQHSFDDRQAGSVSEDINITDNSYPQTRLTPGMLPVQPADDISSGNDSQAGNSPWSTATVPGDNTQDYDWTPTRPGDLSSNKAFSPSSHQIRFQTSAGGKASVQASETTFVPRRLRRKKRWK